MSNQTQSETPVGSEDLFCVFPIYAEDDSCQQMLYVEGHHESEKVIAACRAYAPHAYIADRQPVLHQWMRKRPVKGNIVSDTACDFVDEPGRGARAVTLLALWMPIHPPMYPQNSQDHQREASV